MIHNWFLGFVKLNISNQNYFLISNRSHSYSSFWYEFFFYWCPSSFFWQNQSNYIIQRCMKKWCKTFISNFVSELFVTLLKIEAVLKQARKGHAIRMLNIFWPVKVWYKGNPCKDCYFQILNFLNFKNIFLYLILYFLQELTFKIYILKI